MKGGNTIEVKKDEVVGVFTTYIVREIHFHTSGIDCPHAIWAKLKTLFNKINELEVIQIQKGLTSLKPLSFELIKDYMACIKEI